MSIRKFLMGGERITSISANIGLAALRIFAGLGLAFGHGIKKFPPSDRFIEGVAKLGFPMPEFFGWAAACSEFFGGMLLAAGLATRPAGVFVLITMCVAAFIRHAGEPFTSKEKALLYACIALVFILIGSGKYGLDAILQRGKGTKSKS